MEDLYKIASALFSAQCKHPPHPLSLGMETQILQKWQIRKIKAIFFFLFFGNLKKKKKVVKNNVALVPKSRKKIFGHDIGSQEWICFSRIHNNT